MRRTFFSIGLCLLLGFSLSTTLSAEGLEVVNAVEIDTFGNIIPASGLKIDDVSLVLGDSLDDGKFLINDGPWPAILSLSDGSQLSIFSGERKDIGHFLASATAQQKCRCKCGSENITVPAGSKAECIGRNSDRCESKGKFYYLVGCGLTWVSNLAAF